MDLLAAVTSGLAAASLLFVAVLVARRLTLASRERGRAEREGELRPLALDLLEGERADLGPLSGRDAELLAGILARYAGQLSGSAREHIAHFFEAHGHVERELELLSSRRVWRRAAAAHALGAMGSRRAVPALLAALGDRARDVRASAAVSLGKLAAPEAIAPLVEALGSGRVPRATVGGALLSVGPAALPGLRQAAASADSAVRASAIELIGLLGDAADGAPTARLLRDPSAQVRAAAARALGRLGAEEARHELEAALGDRIPFVRVAAAQGLAAVGDGDALPALLRRARSDSFDAAGAAAHAAVRIAPAALSEAAATSAHAAEAADLAEARA